VPFLPPSPELSLSQAPPLRAAGRELLVIVLGVLIALAADRWMEGVREAADEQRYLSRIAVDLQATVDAINIHSPRMESAMRAAETLTGTDASDLPSDSIVALYLTAGQIGIQRSQLGSDVAFRELVSTGRLNLFRDPTVRAGLAEFYLAWEGLVSSMTEYDPGVLDVGGLTGLLPYRLDRSELSSEARARIVAAAMQPERQERLRRVHASLDHWVSRMRALVSDARELQAIVR